MRVESLLHLLSREAHVRVVSGCPCFLCFASINGVEEGRDGCTLLMRGLGLRRQGYGVRVRVTGLAKGRIISKKKIPQELSNEGEKEKGLIR